MNNFKNFQEKVSNKVIQILSFCIIIMHGNILAAFFCVPKPCTLQCACCGARENKSLKFHLIGFVPRRINGRDMVNKHFSQRR